MRDWNQLQRKTLLELYGMERVLIEEHRGIRAYGTESIRVGTSYGVAVIEGLELRVCCMSRTQIVIRGKIGSVRTEVES